MNGPSRKIAAATTFNVFYVPPDVFNVSPYDLRLVRNSKNFVALHPPAGAANHCAQHLTER